MRSYIVQFSYLFTFWHSIEQHRWRCIQEMKVFHKHPSKNEANRGTTKGGKGQACSHTFEPESDLGQGKATADLHTLPQTQCFHPRTLPLQKWLAPWPFVPLLNWGEASSPSRAFHVFSFLCLSARLLRNYSAEFYKMQWSRA